MNELVISCRNLLEMQRQCDTQLLNSIFEEVNVITTQQSNFWDTTSFFHNRSEVNIVDKVQVVSLFTMLGGRVELDSHIHDFADWYRLWNYMVAHHYITDDDYEFLHNHWMENGVVERR